LNQIEYRKDIDALRGLSVLLVVIYHAFPEKLPGGFIGVDIFFVISGYLITKIIFSQLKKEDFSFLNFYKRRIKRIFPALFTVLVTSLIIGWFILFPDEYKQLGDHVAYATIFILNFSFIKELGYFDVASHYKPLLHLWTLSIEEQYYLIWPAILVLIFRFKLNILIFLISIILISFIANIYFVNDYKDEVFFHSITRVWQLGLGSLLAIYIFDNDKRIEKVIFATRGPVYIDEEQTYEKYFDGFEKTLYQLNNTKHIKNIYYLLENPELDFLPKEVIARPFDYWNISIQDSTVDRSLYRLRMKKYKNLVFEKSSFFAKVNIVDVEPYMCEGNRCFAYKNGNFLYADDNHFSVFGSHYIASKIKISF
jgi:hypothetical protein